MNINKLWKKYAHVYCTEANAVSMDKQGFTEAIGEILSNPVEAEVSRPICSKCKQSIIDVWDQYEKFEYKTIIGKMKIIYCCLACQIIISLEKDEVC